MTDFNQNAGDHFDEAIESRTNWMDLSSLILTLLGVIVVYIWLSA